MRYYGHRPDPPNLQQHVGQHIGAVLSLFAGMTLPSAVNHEAQVLAGPGVLDQSITSSCTGFAVDGACETRLTIAGTPVAHRSPLCAYDWGRCLERVEAAPGSSLLDNGAIPSYVVEGITQWGLCSYATRPTDPGAVNDEPHLAQFEEARAFELDGYSRIDASAGRESVVQALKAALATGYPVTVALQADEAFEDYQGGLYVPGGATKGGHYVYLVGYQTEPYGSSLDGEITFRLVNSWGTTWGEGGFAWMPESCVDSWSDIYAFNVRRIAT